MPGHKNDAEDSFLTKDEERRLGESLRKALISDNPNPGRVGCPDPKTLRDIAFHRKLRNSQLFEEVTAHLAQCSACVRDALEYAEEYKEQSRKRRAVQALLALAAVLVVAVALWAAWRFQTKSKDIKQAGKVEQPSSGSSVINSNKNRAKKEPEITEYQTASIELPSKWRDDPRAESPKLVLNRGKLLLTVRLPVGSAEGKYTFRILDASKKTLLEVQGTARTEKGVIKLTVPMDTSNFQPGDYTLSVLEPGLDISVEYVLVIR